MGGSCCVDGCTTTSLRCRGLSFFKLPKPKSDSLRRWQEVLIYMANRREPSFDPLKASICSRHFEDSCLKAHGTQKRTLKVWSLPTKYLPQISDESQSASIISRAGAKKKASTSVSRSAATRHTVRTSRKMPKAKNCTVSTDVSMSTNTLTTHVDKLTMQDPALRISNVESYSDQIEDTPDMTINVAKRFDICAYPFEDHNYSLLIPKAVGPVIQTRTELSTSDYSCVSNVAVPVLLGTVKSLEVRSVLDTEFSDPAIISTHFDMDQVPKQYPGYSSVEIAAPLVTNGVEILQEKTDFVEKCSDSQLSTSDNFLDQTMDEPNKYCEDYDGFRDSSKTMVVNVTTEGMHELKTEPMDECNDTLNVSSAREWIAPTENLVNQISYKDFDHTDECCDLSNEFGLDEGTNRKPHQQLKEKVCLPKECEEGSDLSLTRTAVHKRENPYENAHSGQIVCDSTNLTTGSVTCSLKDKLPTLSFYLAKEPKNNMPGRHLDIEINQPALESASEKTDGKNEETDCQKERTDMQTHLTDKPLATGSVKCSLKEKLPTLSFYLAKGPKNNLPGTHLGKQINQPALESESEEANCKNEETDCKKERTNMLAHLTDKPLATGSLTCSLKEKLPTLSFYLAKEPKNSMPGTHLDEQLNQPALKADDEIDCNKETNCTKERTDIQTHLTDKPLATGSVTCLLKKKLPALSFHLAKKLKNNIPGTHLGEQINQPALKADDEIDCNNEETDCMKERTDMETHLTDKPLTTGSVTCLLKKQLPTLSFHLAKEPKNNIPGTHLGEQINQPALKVDDEIDYNNEETGCTKERTDMETHLTDTSHLYCDKEFPCESTLQLSTTKQGCFSCSICTSVFSYSEDFTTHMETHKQDSNGEDTVFKCICSDNSFSIQASLAVCKKNNVGNYICPICRERFTNFSERNAHMVIHDIKSSHVCSHCNQSFSTQAKLRLHEKSHEIKKLHVCKQCSKSFNARSSLIMHEKSHEVRTRYACKQCSKVFNMQTKLTMHTKSHKVKNIHICKQCCESFNTQSKLRLHEETHKVKVVHTCNHCNRVFCRKRDLQRHVKTHMVGTLNGPCDLSQVVSRHSELLVHEQTHKANTLQYGCARCAKKFNRQCDLEKHKKTHKARAPRVCPLCDKELSFSTNLRRHIQGHTGVKLYKCLQCHKRYPTAASLKGHMRTHTGEKPYLCHQCGRGFTTRGILRAHIRLHTRETPYACTICNKRYITTDRLKKHMLVHTGERRYLCSVCGKAYRFLSTLEEHMRGHMGEKPYVCTHCNKCFAQKQRLTNHIYGHTNHIYGHTKRFRCSTCDKDFSSSWSLKSHSSIHTGLKPHVCCTCGKAFRKLSSLKIHIFLHTDERPHRCIDCGKGFIGKQSLQQHMLSHSGKTPLCPECGKTFSNTANLQRHISTHRGEKNHICSRCGKGFNQLAQLSSHMRTHTGERPYVCSQCGKQYSERRNLNNHMKVHTGDMRNNDSTTDTTIGSDGDKS